jgi:hypothetical protein
MPDSVSLMSLLSGALAARTTTEAGLLTLRKTNDITKTEGEALVQMLEQSTEISQRLLDVYA